MISACAKSFQNRTLRQGSLGGLYIMKRSKKTGRMYKYYCKETLHRGSRKSKKYFNKMVESTRRVGHYNEGAQRGYCKYLNNASARKLNVNN